MNVDDWVRQNFAAIRRAPMRERTVFAGGRRQVVRSAGERVLLGPNGEVIRVITEAHAGSLGTIVQTDEMQGVRVEPRTMTMTLRPEQPGVNRG